MHLHLGHPQARDWRVFWEGQEITYICIEANDEERWALVLTLSGAHEPGNPRLQAGTFLTHPNGKRDTHMLTGKIEFKPMSTLADELALQTWSAKALLKAREQKETPPG